MLRGYPFFSAAWHVYRILLLPLNVSRGLVLLLAVFGTMEHAKSEEIKFCPAIHASFEQFEPSDLPFSLTTTPGQCQTSKDCGLVLSHPCSKRLELW